MNNNFNQIIESALEIEPRVYTYNLSGCVVKVGKINGIWYYQFPETGMKPAKLTISMRAKLRAAGIEILY